MPFITPTNMELNMSTNDKDKIGDIIEELKRLQIEYNNLRVRKIDSNNQLKNIWPKPKEVDGEIFIVF